MSPDRFPEAILGALGDRRDLSADETRDFFGRIVTGALSDEVIELFLRRMSEKGETPTEIWAAAQIMREHALRLSRPFPELLDTCGTGGDGKRTLNVSTLAAIAASAAGARIGKHGNRSVSSACGSADLLERLGVKIDLMPPALERVIEAAGFGFFFAPIFHPATRFAMPARKRIAGKTIFNLLGPLANPAGAGFQLVGVYAERLVEVIAQALVRLGVRSAMVVHGKDGMDEISTAAPTAAARLVDGRVQLLEIRPETLGIRPARPEAVVCEGPEAACQAALSVLSGSAGPALDLVAVNAGASLWVAERARTLEEGVEIARKTLLSGAAAAKLNEIRKASEA